MPPPVIVTRWSSSSYHGSDAVDASKRNLLAVAAHQTGVPVNLSVNSSRYIAQMSSKHALIVTFFTRWPCAENVCISRFCLRPLLRNDNTANIPLFILLQGCKMIKTQDEPKRHAPPYVHTPYLVVITMFPHNINSASCTSNSRSQWKRCNGWGITFSSRVVSISCACCLLFGAFKKQRQKRQHRPA